MEKVEEEKKESYEETQIETKIPEKKSEMEETSAPNKIKEALKDIANIEGIIGALVIDETGLPIEQYLNISLDIETTSALISVINNEARDAINKMGIGKLIDGIIEMEKGKIFIFDIDPVMLAVLTEKDIMMGLILVKVRKAIDIIKKVLEL